MYCVSRSKFDQEKKILCVLEEPHVLKHESHNKLGYIDSLAAVLQRTNINLK